MLPTNMGIFGNFRKRWYPWLVSKTKPPLPQFAIEHLKVSTHPAVDLAPPPAISSRLGVDLNHVSLLQRELPGVAWAEVVPRYCHTNHFGGKHCRKRKENEGDAKQDEKERMCSSTVYADDEFKHIGCNM